MPTPRELELLGARGSDLERRTNLLLGADVSGIRGPAAKAAALSGYLSALDGKQPSSYDDLLKQQREADARAALEAQARAKAEAAAAERQQKLADMEAERKRKAQQAALDRQARIQAAREAAAARAARDKLREEDRRRLNEPVRKDIEAIDDEMNAIQNAETVLEDKSVSDELGAFDQWVGKTVRDHPIIGAPLRILPGDPEKAQQAASAIEAIAAPLRHAISGASLTPQEAAMARQWMPTADDSLEMVKYKADQWKRFKMAKRERLVSRAEAQGLSTAGYDDSEDPSQWEDAQ